MNNIEIPAAPVLLITFNRPDYTIQVFEKIRQAKVKKLYISNDGPREGNIEDQKAREEIKKIIDSIDWDCEIHTLFQEKNLGCGWGPATAISWAFEKEDRLIILEDDCVPALAFFAYCNQLLERYKDDTRIWLISGDNFNEEAVTTKHSYFFSRYGHSWGWATWKRCWKEMDMYMTKWPLILEQDLFKSAFRTDKEAKFFEKKLNRIYNDPKSTSHIWDFQFSFTLRSNNAISIVPSRNLVSNIGYVGTHSKSKGYYNNRAVDENFSIRSHPDFILCDVNYDDYHFKHHWNRKTPIFKRIIRKIKRMWNNYFSKI